MTDKQPVILDSFTEIHEQPSGLVLERKQEIPDEFLSDLRSNRIAQHNARAGEFMLAASIPVLVHEKWLREGYDCTREPIKETLKRLRNEHLDAFIATDKRI